MSCSKVSFLSSLEAPTPVFDIVPLPPKVPPSPCCKFLGEGGLGGEGVAGCARARSEQAMKTRTASLRAERHTTFRECRWPPGKNGPLPPTPPLSRLVSEFVVRGVWGERA